jgi:hypothetical protein
MYLKDGLGMSCEKLRKDFRIPENLEFKKNEIGFFDY